jgi:hypothetical protein
MRRGDEGGGRNAGICLAKLKIVPSLELFSVAYHVSKSEKESD